MLRARQPRNSVALRCLLSLVALLGLAPRESRAETTASQGRSAALAAQGRHVYERNCQVCHGRWGDGRGEMARGMQPRPRRFTAGVFKFRSTPSGFLPTDADLERTIRGGLAGSSMPVFGAVLSVGEIAAVIDYLKSFSSKWDRAGNRAPALPIPSPPGWFADAGEVRRHAAAGGPVYAVACAPCHGTRGRGDGFAAARLEDDWGEASPPSDLTGPTLRCGPEPDDIYRTLVTGLNGTPMPAFLEATTEIERWDLVAWILTARRERAGIPEEQIPGVRRGPVRGSSRDFSSERTLRR